jgi:hypothetical protein
MLSKDIHGNLVELTLYESYLSHAILNDENLYKKLFLEIMSLIREAIQRSDSSSYNRKLFSIFSLLQDEFPGYNSIDAFFDCSFNIYAIAVFNKLFFAYLLEETTIQKAADTSTLSTLIRFSVVSDKQLSNQLKQELLPENLFADLRIGRKNNHSTAATRKFGITTEENAPDKFKNYFGNEYTPGQSRYKRDSKSIATRWLEENQLPFVSGISGTLGQCYYGLLQLSNFSNQEIRTYLMIISATLVARGHHSFGELHPVIKKIGFSIKEIDNKQKYYEQFLTEDFLRSAAYKNFLTKMDGIKDENSSDFLIEKTP